MLRIKENKWKEFCDNAESFGFEENSYEYYRMATSRREISIDKYDFEIKDNILDNTTICGFKYRGEFKSKIKPYIQDLISQGYVEKVKE